MTKRRTDAERFAKVKIVRPKALPDQATEAALRKAVRDVFDEHEKDAE